MKEIVPDINKKIAGLEFEGPALEASFAKMGQPVEPDFVDAMRRTLGQYAGKYYEDLAARELHKVSVKNIERQPDSPAKASLLSQKLLAVWARAELTAVREAFVLLGQGKAVLEVEVAVASNYIRQDLIKK